MVRIPISASQVSYKAHALLKAERVSCSHWGMFESSEEQRLECERLAKASQFYPDVYPAFLGESYDAKYLHAEQPRAFHQRLGCGNLD